MSARTVSLVLELITRHARHHRGRQKAPVSQIFNSPLVGLSMVPMMLRREVFPPPTLQAPHCHIQPQ